MITQPQELIDVCQAIGRRVPHWTQGAGGNVSLKDSGTLWVKASGFRLDAAGTPKSIAKADLAWMRETLHQMADNGSEAAYSDLLKTAAQKEPEYGRASMETGFHALLPGKWVAHFHSLPALLMAEEHAHEPETFLAWAKANGFPDITFVDPITPGWELTRRFVDGTTSELIFLKNHGVILQTDGSAWDLLDRWTKLEEAYVTARGHAGLSASATPGSASRADMPIKVYFPDVAVFLDRLVKYRESNGTSDDRDAAEIWKAIELLYQASPTLPELPVEISSRLATLPTEIVRRQLGHAK